MAGEWTPINLGDVCTKIGSGATPRGGGDVYLADGPYALIRSQNVHNDGFYHDGLAYIGEKHAAELVGVEVLEGDVLLNITGDSVARACQVDPRVLPARVNQHVAIIRPDPEKLDPKFLRYVLVSREMQAKLLSWAGSGGTRDALTKGMIESLDVIAPARIAEQRAIAHILGTLDDKIELNRQMNETLEAMARALFKSWFVDFDPVRAKVEGRDPGLPTVVTELFPETFDESEGGSIPRGWQRRQLGDLVGLTRGTTYKSSLKGMSGPVLLGLAAIARNGGFREDKLATYGGESPAKIVLGPGEMFTSLKDVTQAADLLGAVARVPPYVRCGRLTQDTVKLEFKSAETSREIVYRTLLTAEYRDYCRAHATGTTNLGLSREDFLAFPVVQPSEAVQRLFDKIAQDVEARISTATAESRVLASLRDTLLPQLISGALSVSSASLQSRRDRAVVRAARRA